MKLKVLETFISVQGEGPYQGLPSYFVRCAGCNLNCAWCDTKELLKRPGRNVEVKELVKEAVKALSNGVHHITVTGGEPLLQQEGVNNFISQLLTEVGYTPIVIFTNGTIPLQKECDALWHYPDYVVDVKPPSARVRKPFVFPLTINYMTVHLKTVVTCEEDIHFVDSFIKTYLKNMKLSFIYYVNPTTQHIARKVFKEVLRWNKKYPLLEARMHLQAHKVWGLQ